MLLSIHSFLTFALLFQGDSLKIKKAKLKTLQQGTRKKKIRTGVGIKTKGKIKHKTRTS